MSIIGMGYGTKCWQIIDAQIVTSACTNSPGNKHSCRPRLPSSDRLYSPALLGPAVNVKVFKCWTAFSPA